MTPCNAETFLDGSYQPYSAGALRCRRALDHDGDHIASLRLKFRAPRAPFVADLHWPVKP